MLEINFKIFPVLETERLILRRITQEDALDFFKLRSNKSVMDLLDKELHSNIETTKELIHKIENNINTNTSITWALCLKTDNVMIGDFGFHVIDIYNHRAEIGYALLPNFQNKGYASEAVKEMLRYAFLDLNLHSIEANINPTNVESQKFITKHHFVKEAHFKENYFFRNQFLDSAIYSLLKETYINNNL